MVNTEPDFEEIGDYTTCYMAVGVERSGFPVGRFPEKVRSRIGLRRIEACDS